MKILNEKIFGNYATVYHRTREFNLVNRIYTEGFKPGSGDMYGAGFYSTYELASQDQANMSETYGELVVKFTVQIADFFIFDKVEFLKSPQGREYAKTTDNDMQASNYLYYQIKRFKMDDSRVEWDRVDNHLSEGRFTSDIALVLLKNIPGFTKKCKGTIFTGSRDGHVLVAYDTKIIMPVSYRIDGTDEFVKVTPNMEYLKQVVDNRSGGLDKVAPRIKGHLEIGDLGDRIQVVNNKKGKYEVIIIKADMKGGVNPLRQAVNLVQTHAEKEGIPGDKFKLQVIIPPESRVKSLTGSPKDLPGDLFCANLEYLTSFVGGPEVIRGSLFCNGNKYDSMEGFPTLVVGDITIDTKYRPLDKLFRQVCQGNIEYV